jgi:hypothetical protein
MPRHSNTVNLGGKRRCAYCPKCDRMFSGEPRLVDRLVELHMEKAHKDESMTLKNNGVFSNLNWGTPVSIVSQLINIIKP